MESIARTRESQEGGARDRIVTVLYNDITVAYLDNNSEPAEANAPMVRRSKKRKRLTAGAAYCNVCLHVPT